MIQRMEYDTFALENFEGPLDFLLHLIQKNEIDIYEIPLQKIMMQYLKKLGEVIEPSVESGAEFIGTAASLLWLKSRMLLPKHEQMPTAEEDELDPRFEIIHQLIDYCRFKEAAKALLHREQQQSNFYLRGGEPLPEVKKNLGIEHLSLNDLFAAFNELMVRAESKKGSINEETWRVSDKIKLLRQTLKSHSKLGFLEIFSIERPKVELIVTFLAVLELMKLGEIQIIKEHSSEGVATLALEIREYPL
jgi:segregation and condensation protein A